MNKAEPVIKVEGLTVRYGSNTVLDNVDFEVQPGEIFVIMGGSGCGKSTLLRNVIGIETPAGGNIWINGTDTAMLDDGELTKLHMGIGMLFQSSALFGSMTIGENVALPLTEFTGLSVEDIESIVKMKLGMVELAGYDNHYPSELSGGMRKRAGIARAMALDPAMLFLDEPSAGLDPVTSAELDLLIKKLNEGTGTTMVIVTHELETIFNISHRIIMLDRDAKGIIAEGDPRTLRTDSDDPRVTNFFNRRVTEKNNEGMKE
ncbi:MAG: ATP-binding cassette domain-containing protein [Syntrophorhabdaceae bacterium]|nr:ATP-binding cassette domain-containing protein [Syntrophorhabdaceae bacterium]